MSRLIQPLLFMFSRCTKNELIRQIEFLKAENELLRSRVTQKRIILKPAERERLIELGKELGTKLKDLITVVAYGTFLKWLRDKQPEEDRKTRPGRPVLVWLCMSSREVIISASTEHPNSSWVVDQTKKFLDETVGRSEKPEIVMHDRDTKFTKEFTQTLHNSRVRTNPLPKASPNLNGRCERFIETIKLECLNKFIIFGKRHLDHLLTEFTEYYNYHRSHMERDHLPTVREEPDEVEKLSVEQVEIKSYVGGLVKAFERKAA